MKRAPQISRADALALAGTFAVLHAAIVLVPGDEKAKATASVFRKFGLYTRGSWPGLSHRGRRVAEAAYQDYDRQRARKKRLARKRGAGQ